MHGDVQLIRLVCGDCPWFKDFERPERAAQEQKDHEAQGHHVRRDTFKGRAPRPINQTEREKLITGLNKLYRREKRNSERTDNGAGS